MSSDVDNIYTQAVEFQIILNVGYKPLGYKPLLVWEFLYSFYSGLQRKNKYLVPDLLNLQHLLVVILTNSY